MAQILLDNSSILKCNFSALATAHLEIPYQNRNSQPTEKPEILFNLNQHDLKKSVAIKDLPNKCLFFICVVIK